MACRDLKKCETVRQEIVMESSNKYVYCRKCDLASMESIRQFAKRFSEGGNFCLTHCKKFTIDME